MTFVQTALVDRTRQSRIDGATTSRLNAAILNTRLDREVKMTGSFAAQTLAIFALVTLGSGADSRPAMAQNSTGLRPVKLLLHNTTRG